VVRFKDFLIREVLKLLIRFNSKVVRFKAPFGTAKNKGFSLFQFQSGAIQRHGTPQRFNTTQKSFNSKVVRFKGSFL